MPIGIYKRTEECNKAHKVPHKSCIRKPFSEEHKKHLSEARKRYIIPREQRVRAGLSQRGKIISEEHRQKLREANSGEKKWSNTLC